MSRLDDELAQAVREAEASDNDRIQPAADAEADEPFVKPAPTKTGKSKRSLGLVIALLIMGGAILTLVLTSFDNAAVFSKGVDELIAERERLMSRNVNVTGTLVKGSLRRRDQPCEYRFKMQKNGVQVAVHYAQCIVPDTFRDVPDMDVDVTATGQLSEAGHFEANHIMAKCPSKYDMKERQGRGEKAPHGEITLSAPASAAAR